MNEEQINTEAVGDSIVANNAIEQEPCPLCPYSGPPQPPSDSSIEVDLLWIACTKCSTWFHSACLLLGDEKVKSTIPQSIIDEIQENRKDESVWFNWTQWINKWYCITCINRASSPSNPRPPRYPLVATLKKGVPPFETSKPKRSASSISLAQQDKQPKRARTSTSSQKRDSSSPDPLQLESHLNDHSADELDLRGNKEISAGIVDGEEGKPQEGRPKRNVKQLDYHNLNNSIATPTNQWLDLIADPAKYGRVILDANYKSLPGDLLSRSWLDSEIETELEYPPTLFYGEKREPIVVRSENGGFSSLGGHIPGKDLTVQDVARLVGPKRMVDVIDVSSQQSSQWTVQKWADYLDPANSSSSSSTTRKKVYNIISLEISDTELAKKVKPPRLVREIDWVDNFWNFNLTGGKGKGKEKASHTPEEVSPVNGGNQGENGIEDDLLATKSTAKLPYPKVQLYCLMGMKGAWTDWHVDFAASSVYYTIHTGSKVFYFIRPTTANLKAYAEWSGSFEKQQDTWLPDLCDEVRKVVLKAGDTMIIPAGYIHAVYTPMDSIVFGGNFIHSYDIDTQLRLRQIEIDTKVPQRFRFPMFEKLCWFVAERYTAQLRQLRSYRPRATITTTQQLHSRVLNQLIHLADFLLNQISILHNPEKEERSKKLVWNRIPHEVIKDPEGLARELKWRVLRELGQNKPYTSMASNNGHGNGIKLENGNVDYDGKEQEKELKKKKAKMAKVFDKKGASRTWMFDPPSWDEVITPAQIDTSIIQVARPPSHNIVKFDQEGIEDEAEQTSSTIKQLRSRVREVEGGGLVKEEQEITFIEKRIVWGLNQREEPIKMDQMD
ncbi:uncharacterized protein L201_005373 [Kwoniella dendrophila CBS 6074]|uniref:[histone H3]-dimethyl-L-lysine(36) demethylase n=1 Tax=Kwoniella dendrophila CBS 6074 TaxID=1295534 RepID=A0AAX4K047_9TREE